MLIFCIGCSQQQDKKLITEEDLRKGTEALSISFVERMPQEKVFSADEDDPSSGLFEIGLKLSNRGAYDIQSGVVTLSLEKGYINDIKKKWKSSDNKFDERYEGNFFSFQLNGKRPENTLGDTIFFYKTLQAQIPAADKESQIRKSTIIATACYDYKTTKSVAICVDPQPSAQAVSKKPCEIKDQTFDSQGGPLAITKISPRPLVKENSATIELLIYVKNKGNGQIIPYNKILDACKPTGGLLSQDSTISFWNTITEEEFKISFSNEKGTFKCGPFPMKLSGGEEDYIRCVYEGFITGREAYTTILNIEISYGYTTSISKDITIEKPSKVIAQ
ncbi:MAG: hypothetical protein QXG86_03365 [Candidatus Woesearchaeota archaeon]